LGEIYGLERRGQGERKESKNNSILFSYILVVKIDKKPMYSGGRARPFLTCPSRHSGWVWASRQHPQKNFDSHNRFMPIDLHN